LTYEDFFTILCNTLTRDSIIPMEQIKRNPEGLVKETPIALRLMPQELKQARMLAAEHGVSCSKLARTAYLAGLPVAIEQLSPCTAATSSPTPTAAVFSSGEASASAAGLSTTAA